MNAINMAAQAEIRQCFRLGQPAKNLPLRIEVMSGLTGGKGFRQTKKLTRKEKARLAEAERQRLAAEGIVEPEEVIAA